MSNSNSFNYESLNNKCCCNQCQQCTDDCNCNANPCNCNCNCGCTMPKKSVFACKPGNSVTIPNNITGTTPLLVANLVLDTSCCCNPSIKIDFNGLINYQSLLTIGTVTGISTPFTATFQLSRVCNGGAKMVLGTWDFTYSTLALATNVTIPFSFSYCECGACGNSCASSGCCIYTLEIIRSQGTTLIGIPTGFTESVNLVNSTLSATAICG